MGDKKGRYCSPKSENIQFKTGSDFQHERQVTARRRVHAERNVNRSACHNPEVRKGIGAVTFVIGIPTLIAGVILTVVAATDSDKGKKYPEEFSVIGPILLVLAVTFFIVGLTLSTPVASRALHRCFSFDNPHSFCRVYFPRLSQFLKPDERIVISRAGMNALKSEPAKSALKRQPAPRSASLNSEQDLNQSPPDLLYQDPIPFNRSISLDVVPGTNKELNHIGAKDVRFSDSEVSNDFKRTRAASTSSDTGSLISLRHCKIYPKSDIWWTNGQIPNVSMSVNSHFTSTEMTEDL